MIYWLSCSKREQVAKITVLGNPKNFWKKSEKVTKNAWQTDTKYAKIKKLTRICAGSKPRTVVRLMQIKNRIRKKRFFVTQESSFCQFFWDNLVLNSKVSKITKIKSLEPSVRIKPRIGFIQLNLRVWFWLRMNAGGVLNTCKSNGCEELAPYISGGRVSNAWAICPCLGNNS